VLNLGDAPLYTTTAVELFFGDPTQGGEPVASWPLDSLGNGVDENQVTFEVDWTFRRTAPLMVFIDRNHVVPEINEQDNIGSHQIAVNPEPEGTNWLVIGAVVTIGIVVFLAMTVLLRRNPLRAQEEEEGLDEKPPSAGRPKPEAAKEPTEGTAEEPGPETAEEPGPEAAEGPGPETTGEPPSEDAPSEETQEESSSEGAGEEAVEATTCPSCGEQVDPDWILCPFCDHKLK